MQQESAETIATEALSWIAAQPDLLDVFVGSTGISPADIRVQADDPAFLGGVLDFLLLDDRWVRAFCSAAGHAPEIPMAARAALPGGGDRHWT